MRLILSERNENRTWKPSWSFRRTAQLTHMRSWMPYAADCTACAFNWPSHKCPRAYSQTKHNESMPSTEEYWAGSAERLGAVLLRAAVITDPYVSPALHNDPVYRLQKDKMQVPKLYRRMATVVDTSPQVPTSLLSMHEATHAVQACKRHHNWRGQRKRSRH